MSQSHNFINRVAAKVAATIKSKSVVLLPSGQLIKHFRLALFKQSKAKACLMPNIFAYNQLYANLYCFAEFCPGLDLSEISVASTLEMLASFEKVGVTSPISCLQFLDADSDKFKEKYAKTYEYFIQELNAVKIYTVEQANALALQRISATWRSGGELHIVQSSTQDFPLLEFFKTKSEVEFYQPTASTTAKHHILECENNFAESAIISFYVREQLEKSPTVVYIVCEDRKLMQLIEKELTAYNISSRGLTKNLSNSTSYALINAIMHFDDDFKLSLIQLLRAYISRFKDDTELGKVERRIFRKANEIDSFSELLAISGEHGLSVEFRKLSELFKYLNAAKTFKDFTKKVFDVFNFLARFELIDINEADALIKLKDQIIDARMDYNNAKHFKQVLKLLVSSQVITTPQIHESVVEFITLEQLEYFNPEVLVVAGANSELIKEQSQKQLLDSFPNSFLTYSKQALDKEKDPSLFYVVIKRSKYHDWLAELNNYRVQPMQRPAPDYSVRPNKYSAAAIEQLMSDPYIFYTKYILKLKTLEAVNLKPARREFGLAMHHALSKLTMVDHQDERLFKVKIAEEFKSYLLKEHIKLKPYWEQKMLRISAELFKYFQENPFEDSIAEVAGERSILIEQIPITLTMRADRVDSGVGGARVMYDYKTGAVPDVSEVKLGIKPQLLVGAYVFNFTPGDRISYLALSGKKKVVVEQNIKYDATRVAEELNRLLTTYMTNQYFAQIHFKKHIPWAYRHINRYDEWYN